MVAVMISPGPRCRMMPESVVGAGLGSMDGGGGGSWPSGAVQLGRFQDDFAKSHRAVVALEHQWASRFFVVETGGAGRAGHLDVVVN